MDLSEILLEAVTSSLLAPIISVIILPVLYGLVGYNKRERRERVAEDLRLDADLARGFAELAERARDPATQDRLRVMHERVLSDFMDKAQRHFQDEQEKKSRPDKKYVILPKPRGLFGGVWSVVAVISFMFAVMGLVTVFILPGQLPEEASEAREAAQVALAVGVSVWLAIGFLFRWLAFTSAKIAAARDTRRPMQQQQQSQSAAPNAPVEQA